jgi:putative membrane protein
MMHWGNMPGMGIGGFGFGWIFMILFWVLLVMGVIYLMKGLLGSSKEVLIGESAENILKKRYASGEISREEYYDKMSVVQNKL